MTTPDIEQTVHAVRQLMGGSGNRTALVVEFDSPTAMLALNSILADELERRRLALVEVGEELRLRGDELANLVEASSEGFTQMCAEYRTLTLKHGAMMYRMDLLHEAQALLDKVPVYELEP